MSIYHATVKWQRDQQVFTDNKYSRGHKWAFDGGTEVNASSSPDVVPLPFSVEEYVDPEEAFVASLSSCHMLFFLAFAAKPTTANTTASTAISTMHVITMVCRRVGRPV